MTSENKPPDDRVKVTPRFLAEQEAKQAAYAEGRRRAQAAWNRGADEVDAPEPDAPGAAAPDSAPDDPAATATRRKGRQKIHDARQFKLEL